MLQQECPQPPIDYPPNELKVLLEDMRAKREQQRSFLAQHNQQYQQQLGQQQQQQEQPPAATTQAEQDEARREYARHLEKQKEDEEERKRQEAYLKKLDDEIEEGQTSYNKRQQESGAFAKGFNPPGYETPIPSPQRGSEGYVTGPQGRGGHAGGRGRGRSRTENGGRGQSHQSNRGQVTPDSSQVHITAQNNESNWQLHGDADDEMNLAQKIADSQQPPPGAPGGVN